jgi:hypothetical protein
LPACEDEIVERSLVWLRAGAVPIVHLATRVHPIPVATDQRLDVLDMARLVRRLVGRCLHGDGRSEYYEDEDYGTKRDKGIPVILLAGTANANCGS